MTVPAVLLLGGTDLTRSVADGLLQSSDVRLAAVVSPPSAFRISYSASSVRNTRFADMARWCEERRVAFAAYGGPDDLVAIVRQCRPDVALASGWYHHLPAAVRMLFPRGCLGVHASLLPRYRGGAPLNWALLNGDAEAGVTLFALADGIDDGVLYDQRRFAIDPEDYIGDLLQKAEAATLAMVAAVLPDVVSGRREGRPQEGEVSYALQRQPSDGIIDWNHGASTIARLVRSVSRPYPGARTSLEGMPLVVWRARPAPGAPRVHGAPGQIVRLPELDAPAIVTGDGLLLVDEVEGPEGFDRAALAARHQRRLDAVTRL